MVYRIKAGSEFDENYLDAIEYAAGLQLIIDKEIMTKDRYKNFRSKLSLNILSHNCSLSKITENVTRNEDGIPTSTLPGYQLDFSDIPCQEIEFTSNYSSKKGPTLRNDDNTLLKRIAKDGLEKVYAQAVVGEGYDNISEIADVTAGFVLSYKGEEVDDSEGEFNYISTAHMQYPIITPKMKFPRFMFRKVQKLDRGTLVLLGQTRNLNQTCKPALILNQIDQTCLSAKLFTVNLNSNDLEYSMYLFMFFCDSENVLRQFAVRTASLSINQFRNMYVPTKEQCRKLYTIDPEMFKELERLSESLAAANEAVINLTEEIKARLPSPKV